jgi:hypothetical protein
VGNRKAINVMNRAQLEADAMPTYCADLPNDLSMNFPICVADLSQSHRAG